MDFQTNVEMTEFVECFYLNDFIFISSLQTIDFLSLQNIHMYFSSRIRNQEGF